MKSLKLIGKFLLAAFTLTSLLYATFAFLTSSLFRINKIDINLVDEASHYAIFPQIKESLDLRLMNLFGDYIWRVDLEKILELVERDARIKEVKVSRILPNSLLVNVVPHTPMANVLAKNSNKIYPLSRNGDLLPPVAPKEATDGPVLRGEIFIKDKKLRMDALELLNQLPKEGELSLLRVSEILYDKKKGFQLIIEPDGATVLLGFNDFAKRLSQAQRVVDYLTNQQMSGRIIDARFAKKVVVKLRNDP